MGTVHKMTPADEARFNRRWRVVERKAAKPTPDTKGASYGEECIRAFRAVEREAEQEAAAADPYNLDTAERRAARVKRTIDERLHSSSCGCRTAESATPKPPHPYGKPAQSKVDEGLRRVVAEVRKLDRERFAVTPDDSTPPPPDPYRLGGAA